MTVKDGRKLLCLLLSLAMLAGATACGAPTETAEETVVATSEPTATEQPDETADTTVSETAEAEAAIVAGIEYGEYNFVTEAEFYRALSELLALHELTMTRYPGNNAYFYFNYGNVTGVKLLTVAKTMDEIEADREAAQLAYEEKVEQFNAEQQAIANGETYVAEEETEAEEETAATPFDAAKDVENSQDYVCSFVLSAADTETDQQLLFLVGAAVWSILNPAYDNTDESFEFLWRALFSTYNGSGGQAVSTIDGIDNSYSFTIPGNAVEAWLGNDEAGNFLLVLTLYAEYDEIIDIAATSGTNLSEAEDSIYG